MLAGGTDVYPAKAARAGWGDMRHADVLDITAVPGLRGIAEEAGSWRIGALTTWTDLIRAELPPLFDGLKLAAREIGGVQIQNRGTLVGNICTASPAGDGAPNLLALEAEVELASRRGRRIVPIASFIDGYRHTAMPRRRDRHRHPACRSGAARARSHFLKLGARTYLVISIVMVGRRDRGRSGGIASRRRVSPSAPARPCRSACRRWKPRSSRQPLARRLRTSCAAAHLAELDADRRHPRLGRLPPRGGAGADARPAARARGRVAAEGCLMQERVRRTTLDRHRRASR